MKEWDWAEGRKPFFGYPLRTGDGIFERVAFVYLISPVFILAIAFILDLTD